MDALHTNTETLLAYCAATARARTARMLADILAREGKAEAARQARIDSAAAWVRAQTLASKL